MDETKGSVVHRRVILTLGDAVAGVNVNYTVFGRVVPNAVGRSFNVAKCSGLVKAGEIHEFFVGGIAAASHRWGRRNRVEVSVFFRGLWVD